MKKILNKITFFALLATMFTACSKDFTDDLVKDNKPEIPVTFDGATTYGFNPYYKLKLSGDGVIKITMSIPSNASVKIKEVTRAIAGATSITPGNVTNAAITSYLDAPVTVNGTTVTITTSITEWNSKLTGAGNVIPATVTAGTLVERAMMFLLTMEDNSTIVPVQCRLRIEP
ncbi:hypothetical protein F0L74_01480 [Chitinophaga agrisoli]|uniref:DUF1735 domain-containing protein n=1 Tax=Chitinophaga agrisoli TaxID=2607653 RepID=A0A5B2W1W9_9BACT|nr:hypothetical protein [Chitinophaga agrisoli]KAA2244672.1 hypothetical protein F0L74_01480 [Chitinophaga agrisoli]